MRMKGTNRYIKALSVMLCLVMVLTSLTVFPLTASAASNVEYVDAKGVAQTPIETATDIAADTTTWTGGWYYASGEVTISSRVTVSGGNTVNLILADGANLTIDGGIRVNSSNKLIIWGQSGGTGKLTATAESSNAGIGGNKNESGGTITINGGVINATGGLGSLGGAGIGGGGEGSGGTITINGGVINATGKSNGAGIGGGSFGSGGNITISGGTVTATGSGSGGGAGIGGGISDGRGGGSGGNITITGGAVKATGSKNGAGIGGGGHPRLSGASGGNITISGGTVTATGGSEGAGIGGGKKSSSGNFTTGTNGNALVIASSITTTSQQSSWNGIIYASNAQYASGNVYGNPVLDQNVTIPNGYTLNVPAGSTLTIPEGFTFKVGDWGYLNNYGTIINNGTLSTWMIKNDGAITNNGTFQLNSNHASYNFTNNGTITNGANGIIRSANRPLTGTGTVVTGVAFKVTNLDRIERSDFTHNGTDFSISLKGYTLTDGTLTVKVGGVELTAGTGYTCTYATVDEYQEATITIPAANLKGNIEITAEGTANVYDVMLEPNGGTINSGDVTQYTYGESTTLPTDVTKENLTFGGWYENSDFSGDPVTQIGTTDTGAKTYYAKWTASVSFDANGGTGNMDSAVVTEGADYTLPANGFTAPLDHEFDAWSIGGEKKAVGDSITVSADTTVTAEWKLISPSYTVTIPATATPGEAFTVSAEATVLRSTQTLTVAITGTSGTDNAFTLKNAQNVELDYTLKNGETVIGLNDKLLALTNGQTGSVNIDIVPDQAKYSGDYTGTVIFTIAFEEVVNE